MYEAYYGLNERPFDLTANPRFLFLSSGHREALSNLQYGVEARKGITLLLGEAGTGKTTLLRAVLEQQRAAASTVTSVYLSNPTLTRAEFYEFLANSFGLSAEAAASKTVFLRELEAMLHAQHAAGRLTALIVDEAQSLPHELLEEIRLLANLETTMTKLVSVVLCGQPELAERLNEPALRQLKQRVALRCELKPFDLRETAGYIAKRIRIAGGDSASLFTRGAVEAIQRGSRGVARTISVVCDNSLVHGLALQRRPVDADIVEEVCQDFDLQRSAPLQTVPPEVAGSLLRAPRPRVLATAPAFVDSLAPPAPSAEDLTAPPAHRARSEERTRPMAVPDEQGLFRIRDPKEARVADDGETTEAELPRRKRFLFF
jgi:general secretion pathway protein A